MIFQYFFINQNFDLMKKTNFSLVLSGVLFLFFFGVQNVSAQYAGYAAPSDFHPKDMDVTDVDFLDVSTAQTVLEITIKNLSDDQGNSATEEANIAARHAYYSFLLANVEAGSGIGDVLPNSFFDLMTIINRYDIAVDPNAVFDEAVQLLEQ